MTQTPLETPAVTTNPARPWQIAVAVLALVALTLLVINVVLRSRVDAAETERSAAVTAADGLREENATLTTRNEELLNQLSTSNERLADLTGRLNLTKRQLAAADADVQRQVAAQKVAERLARQADAGVSKARAQVAAVQAQLRNAQTCSAAGIKALAQIHSGPDIESGAGKAADTLQAVLPACRAGLR